jgi:hypothetical protein
LEGGEKVKNTMISISLAVVLALSAGVVGCTGEYGPEITESSPTVSTTESGEVTSPGEGTFTYVEVTFPDPNFGAAITGPINEEGYIHPSDLQRHSFFSGTT